MRIDKEMTLLEKCKVELEDAVDKFELFDYEYLLDIERVALKYMAEYFKYYNIVTDNEFIVRDVSLCLKLLDIATGRDFHSNNLFHENFAICDLLLSFLMPHSYCRLFFISAYRSASYPGVQNKHTDISIPPPCQTDHQSPSSI